MAKQIDLASLSLAISNSITNQVDKFGTLAIQISTLIRPQDKEKAARGIEAIKKAYNNYGLIVSTSIEKKAYEERQAQKYNSP